MAALRVLGIVTARGGSKGIPKKNLAATSGKSLLAFTSEAALQSKLSRVVLSTDDQEIAEVGKSLGLEVPFLRPAWLAADTTPTLPVLQDVLKKLEEVGDVYDAVFTLQPTNPLRLASDIDGAIRFMERTGCDSVISFSDVGERHPARMKSIDCNGRVIDPPFCEQFEGQRRQDLPKLFLRDGSVYLTRRSILVDDNSIKGKDCRAWIIPQERALNIDTPLDLKMFEWYLSLGPERFPGFAAG